MARSSLRARVLRSLFGLLYKDRRLYWLASTIPFAGQWRVWQRLALPRITGQRVLEVGCGPGKLLADMVRAGYDCTAIDASPAMVAAARDELRARKLPLDQAPVLRGDVADLPFPTASFDTVVSTFPTDYIFEPANIREMGRVLRPGGRLVVVLGAGLLPVSLLLFPLVFLQRLVYGRASFSTSAGCTGASTIRTPIPLEAGGLAGHVDCVRGSFWVAYVVVADKRASEFL